ncbi:unnamed protein product [Darwinula stevensoni]|uniref:Thymosin beta n=1 Tax=Darwinula stevensoni TaxID=69355 RepID=A0A7R9A5G8_9CRUS|nr:unnamed protein product [Darwinula stevensoni]CAG0895581.1 unnamed protein product [Darwinula stevensoni]
MYSRLYLQVLSVSFLSKRKIYKKNRMSGESPKLEDLPKVDPSLKSELTTFESSQLKHAETQEKVVLPTQEDITQEKTHDAVLKGVEEFDRHQLKHQVPQEKNPLPDKDVIEQERGQVKLMEGIEGFDPAQLKHAETQEKNPLPTKEDIEQEKKA